MSVDDNDPVLGSDLAADQRRQNDELERARSIRAQALATQRMDDMDRSTMARDRRAIDLAVKTALREAKVDSTLQSHEARLNRINGSIERVNTSLGGLDKRMSEFIAVGQAVARKSVSTRAFVMTMLGIIVPTAVYALTTLH